MEQLTGRRWWVAWGLVLVVALAATVPTTGDIGLTWDEPAYRYSQVLSAHWWERLAGVRSWSDLEPLLDADALLYYWPYGRFGINFHPPLAGQLNLLTHSLFGAFMKDYPARRMASVLLYAATITLLFGFLARRYGAWVGGVAAGSLLLMPRMYGDGHIAGTDTPGLFLWAVTAIAVWRGLYDPNARRWRVLVGILVGLAFVEKMGAVFVVIPIVAWLVLGHLPRTFVRPGGRADWIDGLTTSVLMFAPLALAFLEIRRLADLYPPPGYTNLFEHKLPSRLPDAILLVPLAVWLIRRGLGRLGSRHPVWGPARPALEVWTAMLAFAPVVGWLGNPAWWRETLPRLAHYYTISASRRGALPDIQIYYWGQTYEYSLPWHNAWVLIAITVPAGILAASVVGLVYVLRNAGRDRLPLYFLVHLVALPVMRMLPTPGHDGVRLFLPTFFFLAAMAGWGLIWTADGLSRLIRLRAIWTRSVLTALVLGSASWQLVKIHPFELSYYNELLGGPRGAWNAGFELTYWYDAFNPRTLEEINERLPEGAVIDFLNEKSNPIMVFQDLQTLGHLRSDLIPIDRSLRTFATRRTARPELDGFPFVWLLTHDSKASAFTRLLFAMEPWYERRPWQLDGLRVATVAHPEAVARAWALWLLTDASAPDQPEVPLAPSWVRRHAPPLARFWGDGVTRAPRLGVHEPILTWAETDPETLRAAARAIVEGHDDDPDAQRLRGHLDRIFDGHAAETLLRFRPEALIEAVEILIRRPDAIRDVLTRYGYTDPDALGGYLDRDLPGATDPT